MSTTKSPKPRPSRFRLQAAPPSTKTAGRRPKKPLPPLRSKDRARSELARLAIDWPRVVLDDMAQECGTTSSSLSAYRTGQRRMPDAVAKRLAEWLRNRADSAMEVAAQLEQAAQLAKDT